MALLLNGGAPSLRLLQRAYAVDEGLRDLDEDVYADYMRMQTVSAEVAEGDPMRGYYRTAGLEQLRPAPTAGPTDPWEEGDVWDEFGGTVCSASFDLACSIGDDHTYMFEKGRIPGYFAPTGGALGLGGRAIKVFRAARELRAAAVGRPASNAVSGTLLKRQLASEAQMAERGTPIFGPGTGRSLRDGPRLARTYGGGADDYAKMGSSTYKDGGGLYDVFETHWYQNLRTGQRFEPKTKFPRAEDFFGDAGG